MKTLLKSFLYFFAGIIILSSCKKTESGEEGTGNITSNEYTFNKATKSFGNNVDIAAQITSSEGIRYVYTYLIRKNTTDSLISVFTPNGAATYDLKIPASVFPINNMSKALGIKVLAKQADNSTIEGFIKITYFDPALPQLKDFPTTLTANLTGNTAIAGRITSDYGITQVDIYDDFQTENTFVLANSITNIANVKDYALNYAYVYRKASQHIKIVAKDIYGQTNELIINMPVDVTIFKPKFLNFAASITPNIGSATNFTGKITSVVGIKKIDIYDDYQGSFVLVSTVNVNPISLNYDLAGSYTYRKRATAIKLIAVDNDNVQSELTIPLNVGYGSKVYRDVNMTAQTTATNTIFFSDDGTTLGNCSLNASEATMSFLFYGTSTGPSFYSPTNTSGVAANFKCNGVGWTIANSGSLRATRLRVLVQGASAGIDNVYAQLAANNIDALDDAFFTANSIAAPAGSSARFDTSVAASTAIYNLTNAYLIYARIPDIGGATYKNALIRVKEVVSSVGTSSVKFDIYIQK